MQLIPSLYYGAIYVQTALSVRRTDADIATLKYRVDA